MIEFIKGKLYGKQPHRVVVDYNGIGLEILVPFSTSSRLGAVGCDVHLLCHLQWRQEDGPQLFGFFAEEERHLFRLLTRVNKVGPKLAINIMSATTPEAFAGMILSEDTVRLTSLKGIGPKLASRLIVELKEGIAKLGIGTAQPVESEGGTTVIPFEDDVREALENLGYTGKEIAKSLKRVAKELSPEATIEETIEAVLRSFSG